MAKQYEGYPSWNSWNVSLWINNKDYDSVKGCQILTTGGVISVHLMVEYLTSVALG